MRITLLFCSFSLLTSFHSFTQKQDSVAIRKYYEENTIYWLGWTKYYKNNQSYSLKNLKKEIILSPDAIHELASYRRQRTYLDVSLITSCGLLLSSLLVQDRQVKLGLLAGSVVTLSISLPFSFRTSAHLSRAIWLHDRDIMLRCRLLIVALAQRFC